jgi:site-specific DNA-methyltransferase (adenine-specific)
VRRSGGERRKGWCRVSKIELIQGDCLDVMAGMEAQSVDAVITDPPYNIGFSYSLYEDTLSDDEYIALISTLKGLPLAIIHYPEETMKYFVPALGVPNDVIVWCYNSNLTKQSRLINFYNLSPDMSKVKQPYKNANDKRIKKLVEEIGSSGAKLYDWFSDIQLVKNISREKTEHPCPVPVALMERIILLTTNEGDTILDPFMGSGTTGVACVKTGRNFTGIELDPEYFAIAQERIRVAQMQPTLGLTVWGLA